MTQEEKEQVEKGKLLVADLCARLPYKVKLQKVGEPDTIYELYSIDLETLEICFWKYKGKSLSIGDSDKLYRFGNQRYKPYLRPMSSMTKDKEKVYKTMSIWGFVRESKKGRSDICPTIEGYRWLNANHFDYNYLIERGLALVAPEGMYAVTTY